MSFDEEGTGSTRVEYQLFGIDLVSDYPFRSSLFIKKGKSDSIGPAQVVFFSCSQSAPFPADQQLRDLFYSPGCDAADMERENEIYQLGAYDVIRLGWGADFYLRSNQIDCHLHNPAGQALVEPYLLGTVLAFWLEREGFPALHASAVAIAKQAVAFLSHSGNGKSTLAAGFIQAGAAFLSDDILAIEHQSGGFWGRPGLPQINMWPDQIAFFIDACNREFTEVEPGLSKKRVPVETIKNGSFCAESRPLACIYIPGKSDQPAGGSGIEILPVPPAEAVVELFRYSFISPDVSEKLGWQNRRLEFFARLVQKVPVRRLLYPAGFEHLAGVTEAVMRDLENLPGKL